MWPDWVIPASHFLEWIKFISFPVVQVKPLLDFAITLGMVIFTQDVVNFHFMAIILK